MNRLLASISFKVGDAAGQRKFLSRSPSVVGRVASGDVVLDDPSVSRQHAEIVQDAAGRWSVRDLQSHNGTTVNGEEVSSKPLEDGDRIGIGRIVLHFHDGHENGKNSAEGPGFTVSSIDRLRPPRMSAEHVSAILSLGQELQRIENAEKRLCQLVDRVITKELGGWWAFALRVTPEGDLDGPLSIEPLCDPRMSLDAVAIEPHVSQTALRAVLRDGEPVIANNMSGEARFQAEMTAIPQARKFGAVACPIRIENGVADVLYVILPPLLTSVEWLMLLSLATEQLRNAEAAWAAREAAADAAVAKHEMALAHAVQSRTLPDPKTPVNLDWAARFEPCLAVAGDYVDVIPRDDGTVLIVIADASGKGMQAALITAGLHAVFHTRGRTACPLPELIEAAGEYLGTFLPATSFVTLAAVLIDPASGEGTCVNCGHPAMLAIDREGNVRDIEGGDNLPLGVGAEPVEVARVRLEPDEMLIGYTDGLSEIANAAGQMLGWTALRERLSAIRRDDATAGANEVADVISKSLDAYRGAAAVADDRTLIVAQLRPRD